MKLFAYGTLLDPFTQLRLFRREVAVQPNTLRGWRMGEFPSGIRYIIPSPYHNTEGGILVDLTPEDLERTDQYEGDSYERVKVYMGGEQVYTYRLRRGLNPSTFNVGLI